MSGSPLQIMVGGRIPFKKIPSVGEVQLLEMLGNGGFGSAWKVIDTTNKKLYVLKIIQGIKPGSVLAQRVRLEAEVKINSEFVIPVIGLEEWDASTFLILFEYFQGQDLGDALKSGGLSGSDKKHIFMQILRGVADAHDNNIIHRDIKPDNILVGEHNEVRVIDFGISKFKGAGITVSGDIMGTLAYMAPEMLIQGSRYADARCDIYSLGHVFYELAMGQCFWVRKGWSELKDLIIYVSRHPAPEEGIEFDHFSCDFVAHGLPIIKKMVKLDPSERYESVSDILAELGYIRDLPPLPDDLHLRSPLLIIESGDLRGARTVLNLEDGETLVLGRGSLVGGDASISRQHLEFRRVGDRYYVRDLQSKHGTLVRGLAVTSDNPLEVRHTDRIKVGDMFMRFVFYPRS